MKKIVTALLLSLSLALASFSAFAESSLAPRFSDDELINIVKDAGYGAVSRIDGGVIKITIDGRSYVLFNHDDGDLQMYYGVSGIKISPEAVNEWNRTKRLSRAYIDDENDPVLEADLLANGGLTPRHVTEFVRIFKDSVEVFRAFLIANDES